MEPSQLNDYLVPRLDEKKVKTEDCWPPVCLRLRALPLDRLCSRRMMRWKTRGMAARKIP